MKRAIVLCLLGLLGVFGHTSPAAAQVQSKKDLEAEVARLKSEVGLLVLPRLEATGAGVKVDIAMAPVERFFAFIQNLGEDKRRVTWSMTRAHGQLVAWNSECKLGPIKIGDLAAFAEFDGGNVSGGGFVHRDNLNGVMLRSMSATWDPSQRHLTFSIGATADFFLPTVRLFLDLDCFGGGNELGKVGPMTLGTNAKTDGRLALSVGARELFAANIPVHLKGDFDLCFSFGSVGTLCIKVEQAINTDFAWEFGGAVTGGGSIDVPAGGQTITRSYTFDLSDRTASTWIRGYSLSISPKVVFRP